MVSKNLILVFCKNNSVIDQTYDSIKSYSEKIGCDLIVHEIKNDWDKLSTSKYFENYHRILVLNENLIIRTDTPNLFEIVPKNELGIFNEGKYVVRLEKMRGAFSDYAYDWEKWDSKYYNTGVILVSRTHKNLFEKPNFLGPEFESYFNLNIIKYNVKIHDITYKFNRTHFTDEKIGITRHDSYIIHYQDAPDNFIFKHIKEDLERWEKDFPHYKYKRNILIRVSAGMGDQLCSEPAIRHTMSLYPDANFYVVTHFPKLFSHLNAKVLTYDEWKGLDEPVMILHTCPDDNISEHGMSHVLFHPTDFASMSIIKKTIPNNEKTIRLSLEPEDTANMVHIFSGKDPNKPLVVVHAGKWWPSKTLPQEWWQKIVDKLSEKLTVVLIGKTIDEKQGFLPIECPDDGYDLRDMTSLGELFSLISLSKVLLTNDSSPLHIAGAFDNWIVTIPTCKHPDHILPFRNGTQYYKTKALYKKLLLDDLEVRYTEIKTDTIDTIPPGKTLYDYIPEVDEVVKEIFEIYDSKD
jgi:hypothetical protein